MHVNLQHSDYDLWTEQVIVMEVTILAVAIRRERGRSLFAMNVVSESCLYSNAARYCFKRQNTFGKTYTDMKNCSGSITVKYCQESHQLYFCRYSASHRGIIYYKYIYIYTHILTLIFTGIQTRRAGPASQLWGANWLKAERNSGAIWVQMLTWKSTALPNHRSLINQPPYWPKVVLAPAQQQCTKSATLQRTISHQTIPYIKLRNQQ